MNSKYKEKYRGYNVWLTRTRDGFYAEGMNLTPGKMDGKGLRIKVTTPTKRGRGAAEAAVKHVRTIIDNRETFKDK